MKKLFAVAAMTVATVGASSAMADNGLFVGAEFGKAKFNGEMESRLGNNVENSSDKFKPSQYGLRVGSYINDNIRVYASLNQSKKNLDDDVKLTNRQLTVSADYVFDFGYPVKPFAGATIGTNWSQLKDSRFGKESGFAFAYGAQAGVMGQFGQFDVELGYRYLKHKNDETFKSGNFEETTTIKDSKTPYLAVSYKF